MGEHGRRQGFDGHRTRAVAFLAAACGRGAPIAARPLANLVPAAAAAATAATAAGIFLCVHVDPLSVVTDNYHRQNQMRSASAQRMSVADAGHKSENSPDARISAGVNARSTTENPWRAK